MTVACIICILQGPQVGAFRICYFALQEHHLERNQLLLKMIQLQDNLQAEQSPG
jgi:hypothetical protein